MCMLLGMSKQLVYVFPGFYNKAIMFSNNLKTNWTLQEVIVWFGCGHGKKKKKRKKKKENSFGLVNKRFGLLPVWGKSPS